MKVYFFVVFWYLTVTCWELSSHDALDETVIKKLVSEAIGDTSNYRDYAIKKNVEGTINLSYVVFTGARKLVVRIKDLSILDLSDINQTQREVQILSNLERVGRHSKVVSQFRNGYVVDFIDGSSLAVTEIAKESAGIAKALAKLHSTKLNESETKKLAFSIWETLDAWLLLAERHLPWTRFQYFSIEIANLKNSLPSPKDDILVLAHNDLNYGNILKQTDGTIEFVDFEFGGISERYFDIANHFVEWAGQECQWGLYPNAMQKSVFLSDYLHRLTGLVPSPLEVQLLQCNSDKFELLSHIYWGLWGELMNSFRPTYPYYLPYASMRLARYERVREELLALSCSKVAECDLA